MREDISNNEYVRANIGVASIVDKIKEIVSFEKFEMVWVCDVERRNGSSQNEH